MDALNHKTSLFNAHCNIFHAACLKYSKMLSSVHGYCEVEKESGRKQWGKYFIVKGNNAKGKQQNFNNSHEKSFMCLISLLTLPTNFFYH